MYRETLYHTSFSIESRTDLVLNADPSTSPQDELFIAS